MMSLLALGPGMAVAATATGGEPPAAELPVIELEAVAPGQVERRLGWRCSSLLREDFSRHPAGSCGAGQSAARELAVEEGGR